MLEQEINTGCSHSFVFSRKVDQYIVGFSSIDCWFRGDSHHVKEISIDLTQTNKNGNVITVQPKLVMRDSSGHIQSPGSSIKVVVLATVGAGNPDIYLQSSVNVGEKYELPFQDIEFIQSALFYSSVKFKGRDHHVANYSSNINIVQTSPKYYQIEGNSKIRDRHDKNGLGQVKGSIIAFKENTRDAFCGYFTQNNNNENRILVDLADEDADFNENEYSYCCFINSFEFSYKNGSDHHVHNFELSVNKLSESLITKDKTIYADIKLKATLKDFKTNTSNLPINKISGFVVAVRNQHLRIHR